MQGLSWDKEFQEREARRWFLSCGFPLQKKSKKSSETLTFKRPEGMHREVYALLYSDKKQVLESQVSRPDPHPSPTGIRVSGL